MPINDQDSDDQRLGAVGVIRAGRASDAPRAGLALSGGPGTPAWLVWLCLSRLALSLIFSAYAGVLP